MALSSPRFKFDATLVRVEANQAALRLGANSHAVHLVQMALIDLGHAMPRSTGNPQFNPDGIFGSETQATVKAFQRSVPLVDDGVVGQKTIRELDKRFERFQHVVRLHFRSVALTQQPFDRLLSNAQLVYGQYGIRVDMANGESLGLSADDEALFDQIDQECNWVLDDGEIARLHRLGTPAPRTDVLVYFVRTFSDPNLLGCGGHGGGRPACTVAAAGSQWSMAHEVGHVLLGSTFAPVHTRSTRNLMFNSTPAIRGIPTLTVAQLGQMRASSSCHAF
jgi:Putative peptidoglycan binding domain